VHQAVALVPDDLLPLEPDGPLPLEAGAAWLLPEAAAADAAPPEALVAAGAAAEVPVVEAGGAELDELKLEHPARSAPAATTATGITIPRRELIVHQSPLVLDAP
jgi:hypothetical protein